MRLLGDMFDFQMNTVVQKLVTTSNPYEIRSDESSFNW